MIYLVFTQKVHIRLVNENILRLVVQTKALVCTTIFLYSRSEERVVEALGS